MGGPLKSFLAVLSWIQKFVIPVASAAVTYIPGIPAVAARIIAILPSLIGAMEEAIPESGQGALKKEAVLATVKAILDGVDATATGGAKGTFDKLRPLVESVIDGTVQTVNTFRPDLISSGTDTASGMQGQ